MFDHSDFGAIGTICTDDMWAMPHDEDKIQGKHSKCPFVTPHRMNVLSM